ncbi:gamma-glutamyltransferase [Candidatus Bathyarchaeota archaeon]|nr:gamma-glutamyltransferase [Candidatus Bathyarchaeota archaeon]
MGKMGGVSSEHPLASVAGLKILLEGGNACDAAVATSLMLSVTQPHLGALGSDLFALILDSASGKVYCINASGWAPRKLSLELLRERGFSETPAECPHSVVVPGLIDGLNKIHKRFCTLEFRKLAEDSVHVAENGFPISYGLSRAIKHNVYRLTDPMAKSLFFKDGKPLSYSGMLVQKALAKTLREVASDPRVFYEGWIAEKICDYLRSKGGVFEIDDFSDYEAEWVDPLMVSYRGFSVYEVPPNSQGATTLIMLNILDCFDIRKSGTFQSERVHLFVEAAKKAYVDKNLYLADPRFASIPLNEILNKKHAQKLAGSIDVNNASEGTTLHPEDTTNFVVFDKWGNVISAIQSIYYSFGSGLMDPGTGVILNCRGTHFTKTGVNRLEPRKRPLHTLSSVIAASGNDEVFALGASGGDFRPQQHVLLLTNCVDYDMSPQEAVNVPRFLWNGGKQVIVEKGFEGLKDLERMGHVLVRQRYPGGTGVAHCGMRKGKVMTLCADVRGDGIPMGPV